MLRGGGYGGAGGGGGGGSAKATPEKGADGPSSGGGGGGSSAAVPHAMSFPGDANLKETIVKYGPLIRTIKVGEGFGELNLINEDIGDEEINSSTATCVAATDVFAISLSEKDYNRIVRHAHEQETMEKMALLRQTQGLYSVPYNKLLRLCLHMTLETFHRGATLVEEGASCTDIFFIKEGECRVGMTRSEPIEANSLADRGRRRVAIPQTHRGIAAAGASAASVGAAKELEVALVGPCETVGDYAFFNSLLQPSSVRATRTTMAYKLSVDSLEKNVPANILDGLRDVSTQRMQKQRDRFVQAMAIRNKIKINSCAVKHSYDAQAERSQHGAMLAGGQIEDSEDSLRTFSSLMLGQSSQSVGYTIGSRSPDVSSSIISRCAAPRRAARGGGSPRLSPTGLPDVLTVLAPARPVDRPRPRSSSRLPNLRVASTRRSMSKLNKVRAGRSLPRVPPVAATGADGDAPPPRPRA